MSAFYYDIVLTHQLPFHLKQLAHFYTQTPSEPQTLDEKDKYEVLGKL